MTHTAGTLPRPYVLASLATIVLTGIATTVGLFVPGFYRDAPVLLPQVYGQDLLTLVVALPVFAVALYYAARGSLRGYVVWLGVDGYLLYTYASYAFMTAFNELYLVYTTLLWLTLYTFVGGLVRLDVTRVKRTAEGLSVRPYVAFQALLAVLVAFLWLAEIVPATLEGTTPVSVAEAELPTSVIYSLDLGIVLPAFVLSAYWLRQRRAWGYAFTAVLLVKAATLGLAVLVMAVFQLRDGQVVPVPVLAIFGLLTLTSLVLLARFLHSIEPRDGDDPSVPTTGDGAATASNRSRSDGSR
ncbi:hypothetical protein CHINAEXTREME_18315 [Halobiforma lacisalsi AJ5]|uniref:Uncharacterized protein n=1 Tax=Natronobacterium lacisalsi AJ5 TaxID=358396 RepID=M0LR92_NATLA|nr:hypothetical protein [Halobiforma lacisalsi]APW99603.1 hypothetical protein CHINAEXTREME_18315 [Halobiforma lacisalsi AJ5]EMA35613.1 hypothetical protein C445_05253 [Halobiforma lacisalsi AJ5]